MESAKFYRGVTASGAVGAAWVAAAAGGHVGFSPCIVKHLTGVPCPSCGATRAALALLQGDVSAAIALNPLGPLLVVVAVAAAVLLARDVLTRRDVLLDMYVRFCHAVRRPRFAVPLVALLCANWAWNVAKGL